ncbi:sigma-54-dependent transcriptional regulator [Chromatocurvus halotolerans]|uniref:Two-component response regulator PilR n=1 Tax=Chromatocurvus halotolerans TaxID=1132028 RepID=A0A4R2KX95_9GAMM|nr:sigma-54 dependent transcriptional regulator [Chromatocurvus halotolerans]TCO74858.1 two-component response regulator PilR [Chromatocurvus halotolerans]
MTEKTVLIVDDEPDIRELLEITLSRMGLLTRSAANLTEAVALLAEAAPDLCLTDMRLPDGNGIDLVAHIQSDYPQVPVAVITAHGSVDAAIAALKAGAFDFISKPVELENLRNLVLSALELGAESSDGVDDDHGGLIGETPQMQRLRQQIDKLARSQAPVHIHGESGTGKEVVARLIHRRGPRASGPFIAVNCGAIPAELMESELFGHVKGSFTGAHRDKSGLFQAASGGTLFLDEVADLPLSMQVKLLRAIQEKTIRPVGSSEETGTDIRLLSATHKDLTGEVEAERFREDLYFRINVIGLKVPALRERLDDIPRLATTLLQRIASDMGISAPVLQPAAIDRLQAYHFPGNVRELENILERALALAEGSELTADDLQLQAAPRAPGGQQLNRRRDDRDRLQAVAGDLPGYMDSIEREVLGAALERYQWNRTEAASALGISFRSLRYRLKKLGLDQSD